MKNFKAIMIVIAIVIAMILVQQKGGYLTSNLLNTKLSKNFSIREFSSSDTADKYNLLNSIPVKAQYNIKALVKNILQPTRDFLGFPLRISSGYRSKKLIEALIKEGYDVAENTQHGKGYAVDLVSEDNAKIFNYIKENLDFDQLIWERGNRNQPEWVHVSFKTNGNRNQVLYL